MNSVPESADVVVVGCGNAALCAALSAREAGATVLVLERAPKDEAGGNSRFTAGAFRCVYDGVEDLRRLMPDLTDSEIGQTDFGTYTQEQFFDDMGRITEYRCDPDLTEILVRRSRETLLWMRDQGIRFQPIWGRQAFRVDGRFRFWGGLTVEAWGGGPGLVDGLVGAAGKAGIGILYGARALSLEIGEGGVTGIRIRHGGRERTIRTSAVVLASGGFEANHEWRARYLGPGWDLAKVRGSRFNTGDGIRMAMEIGASPYGHWSGCHAVGWDRNAPEFGDLQVGDGFQKHSYPFGIMLNAEGDRFVDEGADFRNYTYARYGREILNQPGQFAWQVFDSKVSHLLRDEYRIRQVSRATADTLEQLVARLDGVNEKGALGTIEAYNRSVDTRIPFDPNTKDGRGTIGLEIPKTNWANTLDEPPYEAYAVTCGVTFTFGGLRIDTSGNVLDTDLSPIGGLFAAGELVGGLFYFNYPGGTGLMAGSVFGRLAGRSAAQASGRGRAAK
ncbi:MAG: FAD-binding dehydrogenase [Gammaproteobacteria bacterium]|nr:FAD-binding dehydrogenase [Gammaproteobacteria bacterium]MYD77169.1 FAD-binding dehydrogenase [Gammaproteobacteria bacterium]MYJ53168.1 FAD-binding dehydrogenase [Gammaproteobacteria bacterium]